MSTEKNPRQIDAPRDKRTYFREINYIAAAFQYQKKNYKSA
ncbi:glucosamine-6-phosphate deaminase [Escherichia coli]|nr:glucosamine-6-phosphate deaminase [Escherichia coli]